MIFELGRADWEDLLKAVKKRQCTPFIGAGASVPWLPLGSQIGVNGRKSMVIPWKILHSWLE